MVKQKRNALCVGCTVLSSASSWATTIEPGQGNLSINCRNLGIFLYFLG
jgi:hypothetical protein